MPAVHGTAGGELGSPARLEAVAQRGQQLHSAAARRRLAARRLAGAAPALGQELRVPLVDERLAAHQVVLAQHHVPLRARRRPSVSGFCSSVDRPLHRVM